MTNCRYLYETKCLHPKSGVDLCILLLKPTDSARSITVCKLEHGVPRPLFGISEGLHPRIAKEKLTCQAMPKQV